GGDGLGGVERNGVGEAGGEALGELGHLLVDQLRGLDSIGAGELIDAEDARGSLVVTRIERVDLLAELDAGYVTEVQDGTVGVGAEDDVAELLRSDEAALRLHGVGELLAGRHRLPPPRP